VQLGNGRILVAWTMAVSGIRSIRFAVLDSSYDTIAGPSQLAPLAATEGSSYVSVTADSANHGILTWMDWRSLHLYYALLDADGHVLTAPMIFRSSPATSLPIETSHEGYGATSYSWRPPSGVDGVAAFGTARFGGLPGGKVALSVSCANHGVTPATHIVLTATLDSELIFLRDTSGVLPTVSGNDVVWHLPDLGTLDSLNFVFQVQVPSEAPYGTRYPVALTLTSDGPEANPADNSNRAEVTVTRQLFLPLVVRGYG
jgi:hypothetical protein